VTFVQVTSTTSPPSHTRLAELDALRGLAAMAVVLFHYFTKFDELFGHTTPPVLTLPWGSTNGVNLFALGHYGVNLFFMISGFVIFMTLERTKKPMDFVVSRFSRLFPAYWVAVAVTFSVVWVLGLPGKEVSWSQALANLSMVHSFFNVPHVDGVYWTLEVELLFYAWAFLAYRLGCLHRVHALLLGAMALRLAYFIAAEFFRVDLPWIASRYLILNFIAWFALGVMVYRLSGRASVDNSTWRADLGVAACAIGLLGLVHSPWIGVLAFVLTAVLWGAASGRLPWLWNRVFLGLGIISYTLYLVHENIGWAVMRPLQAAGWSSLASIFIALLLSLTLATALTLLVERPAMAWIRSRYKQRQANAITSTPAP
jgi:peptidoglycan/LPS O-acetylase OafA/YrhL